jgi:simple sugar transport system permease protein
MTLFKQRRVDAALQAGAFALALAFTSFLLKAAGASPLETYRQIIFGSVDSCAEFAYVLRGWVPLILATAGVLITFTAGLWNIGVEGQIMLGAVFTTWGLRMLQGTDLPPAAVLAAGIAAGMIGGALWACLAGALKTYGGVHEIFGGLGLNFVATAVSLWLIFGPWKRPGVGSMSGTEPFPETLWMSEFANGHVSPWALGIAIIGIALVYLLVRNSYFGLRLKAVGKNVCSSYRLGIPTARTMLLSFVLCGVLAGAAGALQVTSVYHRLIPSISSGYGFLALLVAMLAAYRALWAIPIALFFAAINVGSIQLPIMLQLDSSLSGILQGALVLFVLMVEGARKRWLRGT